MSIIKPSSPSSSCFCSCQTNTSNGETSASLSGGYSEIDIVNVVLNLASHSSQPPP